MKFVRVIGIAFLVATLSAVVVPAWAAGEPAIYSTRGGIAIQGYDPVAYFTDGKPVPGKPEFTHLWNGATWQFASAEHRDMFRADPAKYAPQYGGYCAYGAAQGYHAPTQPTTWRILDGKLYLNYNADIQKTWVSDPAGYIVKADRYWSTLQK